MGYGSSRGRTRGALVGGPVCERGRGFGSLATGCRLAWVVVAAPSVLVRDGSAGMQTALRTGPPLETCKRRLIGLCSATLYRMATDAALAAGMAAWISDSLAALIDARVDGLPLSRRVREGHVIHLARGCRLDF